MAGNTNSKSSAERPMVYHTPSHHDDATAEASRRKKLLMWGLPSLALLLIGGGIYWFFFLPRAPERVGPVAQSQTPSVVEKKIANDPPAPTRAAETKPQPGPDVPQKKVESPSAVKPGEEKIPAKKPGPPEIKTPEKKPIVATNVEPIAVSADRLHKQQLADAAGASRAYDRKLVDIRGNYARSKANNDSKPRPVSPFIASTLSPDLKPSDEGGGLRIEFATEQGRDAGQLTVWPDSLETALRQLLPGQCVTLRGVYEAPGKLHDARLIQTRTPADELYFGRQVELVGYVGKVAVADGIQLATLRFEPGVTDSVIGVECSFKKQEPHQPDGLERGQFVIVRGRVGLPTFNVVRMHDCQILYDFLPKAEISRINIEHFVRDYDQYARDQELSDSSETALAVTATELLEAYKVPAEGSKRFGGRWLEVDGTMESVDRSDLAVILEGGTDQGLKAKCMFVRRQFSALKPAARMAVRGWCNGIDGKFVRLDNCEVIEPAPRAKAGPRVDAEFFPFRTDKTLVYETAYLSPPASRSALRQTFTFKGNRVMEIVGKRTGQLKEKTGGLAGGVNWNSKSTAATPLLLHYRLRAGHVEIAQSAGDKAQPSGVWEPVIATGMQAGDTWTWAQYDKKYIYTVVAFSEYAAALSVIIKKTTETTGAGTPTETIHVYARGVGEVERKLYEVPAKGPKRLIMETKLVR